MFLKIETLENTFVLYYFSFSEKFHSNDNIKAKLTKQTTIGDLENTHLNPKTEGRIRVLSGRVSKI